MAQELQEVALWRGRTTSHYKVHRVRDQNKVESYANVQDLKPTHLF